MRDRITQQVTTVNHRKSSGFVVYSCYEIMGLVERHVRSAAARFEIEAKKSRVICELLPVCRSHEIIELVAYISGTGEMVGTPKEACIERRCPAFDVGWIFKGSAFACFMDNSDDAVIDGLFHVDCVVVINIDDDV